MSYTLAEREAAAALLDLSQFESAAGVSHADVTATASDLGTDEALALTVLDAVSEIKEGGGKKKRGGAKASAALKKLTQDVLLKGASIGNAADEAAATLISSLPSMVGIAATGIATRAVINHPTVLANMVSLVRAGVSSAAKAGTVASWSDWGAAGVQVASELTKLGGDMAKLSVAGPYVPYIIASLAYRYRASKSGKSVVALIKDDIEAVKSKGGDLVQAAEQYTYSQISAFKLSSAAETGRLQRRNVSGITSGIVRPVKRPAATLQADDQMSTGTLQAEEDEEPASKRGKIGGKRRRKTVRKSKGKKRVTRRALFAY
jgi:hypothetical protein